MKALLFGRVAVIAILAAGLPSPAFAEGVSGKVCALIEPFLKDPGKFLAMRGVQTSDKAWNSKANPQADDLNAVCTFNTYVENRNDLNCNVGFPTESLEWLPERY